MSSRITIKKEGVEAMSALVQTKSPDAALLYALAVSEGGKIELERASLVLGMNAQAIERAKNLLLLYELAGDMSQPPARGDFSFTPEEIIETKTSDFAFMGLIKYVENAFGRMLTKGQTEILLGIYHSLGLPAEVIMLAVNHCKMREILSIREIEKCCYDWADRGLCTYEEAERHLRRSKELREKSVQLLRALNIFDRKPVKRESEFLNKWIELDMSIELVRTAYDITVFRTGKLEWRYMDKILSDWYSKGIKTQAQAEQQDKLASSAGSCKSGSSDAGSVVAFIARAYEEKRKNRDAELAGRAAELRKKDKRFESNERMLNMNNGRLARAALSGKAEEVDVIRRENSAILENRKIILLDNGCPENWLDNGPDCAKCGDFGYIGSQMCDCFKLACRQEQDRRSSGIDVK